MSTLLLPESMNREERSWTVHALDIVSEVLTAYKISEEESEANLTLANDLWQEREHQTQQLQQVQLQLLQQQTESQLQ